MIEVQGPPKRDGTHYITINGSFVPISAKEKITELKDYIDSINVLDGKVNVKMLARRLEEILKLL